MARDCYNYYTEKPEREMDRYVNENGAVYVLTDAEEEKLLDFLSVVCSTPNEPSADDYEFIENFMNL